jgi:hypothetical protein
MAATRCFDCSARQGSLRADRALSPPTSSSLWDEKRVPSLLLSTAARDPCLSAPLAKAGSASSSKKIAASCLAVRFWLGDDTSTTRLRISGRTR